MDKEKLRKIDELVAEKVMGWKRWECRPGSTVWIDENGRMKRAAESSSVDFCSCEIFSPSTEISDAWEVVEKLGIIPNSFYIGYKMDKNGKKIYRAFFQKENPITTLIHTYEADAETAPLAISLAALKAVGVDVE